MLSHLRPALTLLAVFTLLTGLAYPFAMTGLAGIIAPVQSTASLVERDGQVVGSSLLGQVFTAPGYLHPRPSATDYNAASSGATNLGPTSAALVDAVAARRAAYAAENGGATAPLDALTTSASGLDPDVSPENARAQAARIATARGVAEAEVLAIIDAQVAGPLFGLYGLPRVNVLAVNLALDAAFPQ